MTVMTARLTQATPPAPSLEVLGGRHQGVNLLLTQACYVIGSDAADQLVLGDAGVVAGHLQLRLDGRRVCIEARGEQVVLEQRGRQRLIARGTGYRTELPVVVRLGEARLRLSGAPGSAPVVPVWYGRPQWLLALGVMGLCAGAVAMLQPAPAPAATHSAKPVAPLATALEPTLEQARQDLQQRARVAGLQGLSVTTHAQGLRIAGSIAPGQREAWQSLQRQFDTRYGRQFVLHGAVQVRPPTPRPVLELQAAWFGSNPYVIDSRGERLYPGAVLDGGWRIERIADDRIQLAHEQERFELSLAAPAAVPQG